MLLLDAIVWFIGRVIAWTIKVCAFLLITAPAIGIIYANQSFNDWLVKMWNKMRNKMRK